MADQYPRQQYSAMRQFKCQALEAGRWSLPRGIVLEDAQEGLIVVVCVDCVHAAREERGW